MRALQLRHPLRLRHRPVTLLLGGDHLARRSDRLGGRLRLVYGRYAGIVCGYGGEFDG